MPLPSADEFQEKHKTLAAADYLLQYRIPPEPGYSLLVGPPGRGKTNLAFQLGCDIQNGLPHLGIPTKQGKVGVILFEGGSNLTERIEKLKKKYGAGNLFDIDQWPIGELHSLKHKLIEACKGYNLIILDPFNKFNYGDMTRTMDMQANVRMLDEVATKADVHLLVLHHVRKRGNDPKYVLRPRDIDDIKGATELVGGSLTAMLLADETQDDLRAMGLAHQRGAPALRGPDYSMLHFLRAQASPEDLESIGLYFDRAKLEFRRSGGLNMISTAPPMLMVNTVGP